RTAAARGAWKTTGRPGRWPTGSGSTTATCRRESSARQGAACRDRGLTPPPCPFITPARKKSPEPAAPARAALAGAAGSGRILRAGVISSVLYPARPAPRNLGDGFGDPSAHRAGGVDVGPAPTHLHRVLEELRAAKDELENTEHHFGGHKKEAIE